MNKHEKNEHDFEELYARIRSKDNKINQSEFIFMKRKLKEDIKNGNYDGLVLSLFDSYSEVRNQQLLEVYKIADCILNTKLDDSIEDLINAIGLFGEYTTKTLDMTDTFNNEDKMMKQYSNDMSNDFMEGIVDDINLILIAYSNGLSAKLKPSVIESKKKCAYDQIMNECLKVVNYFFSSLANEYEHYIFSELLDLQKDIFKQNTAIHTEIMVRIKTMNDDIKKQMIKDALEKSKKPIYTDNYKKLNEILKSKGYTEIRQRGSHKIFSNGIRSIPIPQHNIGKGLFSEIRKEIDL